MALLIFWVFFLTFNASAFAEEGLPGQSVKIVFDGGNPDASVGIVGEELLELNSLYEEYEVVGFEEQTLIVKDRLSDDRLRWPQEGEIDEKVYARARQLFTAKQMRALYLAQLKYRDQFGDRFAPSLNALLDQGNLHNGFDAEAQKQNYRFAIVQTGQTRKFALQPREPTFYAIATPLNPETDPYFSVDQLGQIRFAPSLNMLSYGPIWDYADKSAGLKGRQVVYA